MNDIINNIIVTIRARFTCLEKSENLTLWKDKAPLKFTEKAALAETTFGIFTEIARKQSAVITGNAQDKLREEKELEDEAYKIARAVVNCARDDKDETLAAKYDFPISSWRRLRNEALLQRARDLETDATALTAGPHAIEAAKYGITATSIAKLKKEGDDYHRCITAPRDAISERTILTADLQTKSREILDLFDQMDDLALQFKGTPAGDSFVTAYLASGLIIERGRGPSAPTPPVPPVA